MALLYPTWHAERITDISGAWLKQQGIKALLLDIDNTLTEHNSPVVLPPVSEWLAARRQEGIAMILVSNNSAERVKPFAESLRLPFTAKAKKPLSVGFRRAAKTLGVPFEQCLVIGDQVFTDIVGANVSRMASVLLEPLAKEQNEPFIQVKRKWEQPLRAALETRQRRISDDT